MSRIRVGVFRWRLVVMRGGRVATRPYRGGGRRASMAVGGDEGRATTRVAPTGGVRGGGLRGPVVVVRGPLISIFSRGEKRSGGDRRATPGPLSVSPKGREGRPPRAIPGPLSNLPPRGRGKTTPLHPFSNQRRELCKDLRGEKRSGGDHAAPRVPALSPSQREGGLRCSSQREGGLRRSPEGERPGGGGRFVNRPYRGGGEAGGKAALRRSAAQGELEEEGAAPARLAFGPDAAALRLDELAGDGKAKPGAACRSRP